MSDSEDRMKLDAERSVLEMMKEAFYKEVHKETAKRRQAQLLAEFTSAALSNPTLILRSKATEMPAEPWAVADQIADYAKATLDEYLKRLDGRDSDTELFESLEWSGKQIIGGRWRSACPKCGAFENDPHGADCKLAKRLGR